MKIDTLSIGSKCPDFNLKGVDLKNYNLKSFTGKKALVVIFSCNHCPYVQAYEDRIISLQKKYFEKSLQIIAINSNDDSQYEEDSFEGMIDRAKEKEYNFPYLRDDDQSIANAFGATHTPEIFLFDSERILVYHGKIDDNWLEENKVKKQYLKNAIEETLAGKEISIPETYSLGCTIKWRN
ncbi:MAG: thioredoxin family protein [Bacteroidetes bacterium]|nr:thioredoxin family protein [Bacteroidota bacterium]